MRPKDSDSDDNLNNNDDNSASGSEADWAPTPVKQAKKTAVKKVQQNDDSDDGFSIASSKISAKPKASVVLKHPVVAKPMAVKKKAVSKLDLDDNEENDISIKRAKPTVISVKAPVVTAAPSKISAVASIAASKQAPKPKKKNKKCSDSEMSFGEEDDDSDVAEVVNDGNSNKAPRRAAASMNR